MSNNSHIPATIVKISDLPEGQPTHLVGVSITTGQTVKYSVGSFFIQRKHDFNIYSYCGKASSEANESDNVWTIDRIEILEDGTTIKKTAISVNWTNRYTHNYI
jgi:hypothetical protein